MRRRDFITLLGGAAVTWPLMARAQQAAMPVIGLLNMSFPASWAAAMDRFHRGLGELGYVEGRNVAIEYRWAENRFDRLDVLAADLIERNVTVIFAGGPPVVRAIRARSATIPIVFFMGEDPVKEGLVASLNRPGGNITGITNFQNQLFGKQLEILRDIAPTATSFAFLVNPNNPNAEPDVKDAEAAANVLRRELRVLRARNEGELEPVFATMVQERVGGLLVGVDSFGTRAERFVAVAARHGMPAMYQRRDFPVAGGLMSYGATVDTWRQVGIYVGRILKGEKPANLPVQQSSKFEFVINLKAAKELGLTVPQDVLSIADEVIE